MTKQLLWIAAGIEAVTGIAAIISPSFLVWLLWAIPLTIGGTLVARVAGFALVSLAIACRPARNVNNQGQSIAAMLVYNVLVALLLLVTGFRTPYVGILLWAAFVLHSLMSVLFVVAWRRAAVSVSKAST